MEPQGQGQGGQAGQGVPRYRVPDELRQTLLDFTIAYLLERPTSLVDFGLNFFQRLRGGDAPPEQSASGRTAPAAASGQSQGPPPASGQGPPPAQSQGPPPPQGQGRTSGQGQPSAPGPSQPRGQAAPTPASGQAQAFGPKSATAPAPGDQPPLEQVSESDMDMPLPISSNRRKSVFSEAYNPEEDADETPSVVHPKSDAQRASLSQAVKPILLFRSLDGDQIQKVLDAMFERKVKAGEYVIQQGDDGDNFYVIEKGKYKVYVKDGPDGQPKMVGGYDSSGSFGELALMYNAPRAATVQAETDGSLWAMDRQTFRHIVLKNAYQKRQMYESLLNSVPMLKTLDNYERMNVADALLPRVFEDGQQIMKQGDTADGMYFVEDGTVRIVKLNEKGQETEINKLSKGGYFGELALLTRKPRAATVIAAGNVKTAFLDVEAFERLLGPCMDIMKRNVDDYEQQLISIFGTKSAVTELR